jgi:hypothetical protein
MSSGIIDLKHSLNLLTLRNRDTTKEDVVVPGDFEIIAG